MPREDDVWIDVDGFSSSPSPKYPKPESTHAAHDRKEEGIQEVLKRRKHADSCEKR